MDGDKSPTWSSQDRGSTVVGTARPIGLRNASMQCSVSRSGLHKSAMQSRPKPTYYASMQHY